MSLEGFGGRNYLVLIKGNEMALAVKNPSANARDIRDTRSISGSGNSLVEGTATHSSILS